MLNLTAAEQAVVKSDSAVKNFRVHFPNGELSDITYGNIVYGSVSFTESVCSQETFRFGCAEASVIEFETVGIQNMIGMLIECSMEFTNGQTTVVIPYGTFLVDSCPRDHQNMEHRKVTAYSLIKYMLDIEGFLQNRILPVPTVHVSLAAITAYVTGDTSQFTETAQAPQQFNMLNGMIYMYDSTGKPYYVRAVGGLYRYDCNRTDTAYKLEYKETGTTSGAEIGQMVIDWLDNNGYDLTYDSKKRKVFASNADAVRFMCAYLWHPTEYYSTVDASDYGINYRQQPAIVGAVVPCIHDDTINAQQLTARVNCLGASVSSIDIRRFESANIYTDNTSTTLASFTVSFTSESSFTKYAGTSGKLNSIAIKSTMDVNNTLAYIRRVSNRDKMFYKTMYTYSNAYSNRELIDGWAEINGAFVHSERNGSISMESLNNSAPYAITSNDVDGSAWWDEYDVNPIGAINYTFKNPFTNKNESGTYQFGTGQSVYDLSGNKLLESIDFTPLKVASTSAMTDTNYFYRYNGDFYYWDGSAWVNGGKYTDVRSIVHYVLEQLFIPHITAVNFTPVEMNLRGMPYLEAGDAFTFTAEDGTVLNSYILNHSFTGGQYLQEAITSVSGEII